MTATDVEVIVKKTRWQVDEFLGTKLDLDQSNPELTRGGSGCEHYNTQTGDPSCVAGHIMAGLTPDLFARIKAEATGNGTILNVPWVEEYFEQDAIQFMATLQRFADDKNHDVRGPDGRRSWREARELTLEGLGLA